MVLPGDLIVPQGQQPTVLSVVALVAGAVLAPQVKLHLGIIVDPQPLPLPSFTGQLLTIIDQVRKSSRWELNSDLGSVLEIGRY